MHTPETNSEGGLPPTPDMFPIIRPIELESHSPLSENKINIVLNKTKDIILALMFLILFVLM